MVAMLVTEDMVSFAHETILGLRDNYKAINFFSYFEHRILSGYVRGPFNQVRRIEAFGQRQPPDVKSAGNAHVSTGTIRLFVDDINICDMESLEATILHELIHVFDPKLNDNFVTKWKCYHYSMADHGIPGEKEHHYYLSPWEQDAIMASFGRVIVRGLLYTCSFRGAKQTLATYFPTTAAERCWYNEWKLNGNPRPWRKYKQTLYHILKYDKTLFSGIFASMTEQDYFKMSMEYIKASLMQQDDQAGLAIISELGKILESEELCIPIMNKITMRSPYI